LRYHIVTVQTPCQGLMKQVCQQDAPMVRQQIQDELQNAVKKCTWETRAQSPSRSFSISHTRWRYPALDVANITLVKEVAKQGTLAKCFVNQSGHESWTFERAGPFTTVGYDLAEFQNYAWYDAGEFSKHLKFDKVLYITAFSFAPVNQRSDFIGYPPIRLHHHHVSSTQAPVLNDAGLQVDLLKKVNNEGLLAIEFDVHGDRQCHHNKGGIACLTFAYPPGYGMHLTQALNVFGSFNDVRPADSAPMEFFAQYGYRLSGVAPRPICKIVGSIGEGRDVAGDMHGGIWGVLPMLFRVGTPTEYLFWSERRFLATHTITKVYYHSHHEFTADFWTVSATASELGLTKAPLQHRQESVPINLTAHNLTIDSVQEKLRQRLRILQQTCLQEDCRYPPRLRCWMNQDRWEVLPDGDVKPRYVAPHCIPEDWPVQMNDRFTIIYFNKPIRPLRKDTLKFAHASWYALAVQTSPYDPLPRSYAVLQTIPYANETLPSRITEMAYP